MCLYSSICSLMTRPKFNFSWNKKGVTFPSKQQKDEKIRILT